jgi:hypothetical protein
MTTGETVIIICSIVNTFGIIGGIVGIIKWVIAVEIRLTGIETTCKIRKETRICDSEGREDVT